MMMAVIGMTATMASAGTFADFDRRATKGDALTVAFLGGSLTWGANASDPQKTSYRALVGKRLREKYPLARFTFVDAAIGGTGAQLGVFRLQRDVLSYHPDLVFLDFTLNDDAFKVSDATLSAYESILRQVIGKGQCPVVMMFMASRGYVTAPSMEAMLRRTEHLKMAAHYHLPVGDAIKLMRDLYAEKKLDLDQVWPPDSFDNTHPVDAGYKLYADAAWTAFEQGIRENMVQRLPENWISNNRYANVLRLRLADLGRLPEGWAASKPETNAVAFDFDMSRWLDGLTRAANNQRTAANQYKLTNIQPAPLTVRFKGSSVLLFGESKPVCGTFKLEIDGKEAGFFDAGKMGNACGGTAHMVMPLVDGLDGKAAHTMSIIPQLKPDQPQELRIESICVAGPEDVWIK